MTALLESLNGNLFCLEVRFGDDRITAETTE